MFLGQNTEASRGDDQISITTGRFEPLDCAVLFSLDFHFDFARHETTAMDHSGLRLRQA